MSYLMTTQKAWCQSILLTAPAPGVETGQTDFRAELRGALFGGL